MVLALGLLLIALLVFACHFLFNTGKNNYYRSHIRQRRGFMNKAYDDSAQQ